MPASSRRHVLVQLREVLGMNQTDFATLIGYSPATVQSVELCRLDLSEGLAARIGEAVGISAGWLLENNSAKPAVTLSGMPYTKETFELWQVEKRATSTKNSEAAIPVFLLGYYAVLRRIMAVAVRRGVDNVALYRLGKFVEGFAEEMGMKVGGMPFFSPAVLELAAMDVETALHVFGAPRPASTPEEIERKEALARWLGEDFQSKGGEERGRILARLGWSTEGKPQATLEEMADQFAEHLALAPGIPFNNPEQWSYKHPLGEAPSKPEPEPEYFPVKTVPRPAGSPRTAAPPPASPARGSAGKASSGPRARAVRKSPPRS